MKNKSARPPVDSAPGGPFYRLRLFVAGDEPNSVRAKEVLFHLCEMHLRDRCEIQIVDVYKDYRAAIDHNIVAVPALMVEAPKPRRIVIGSLSDEEKVLAALGLSDKGVRV